MDWVKDINWEKLKEPHPMFKPFVPDDPDNPEDPFYKKVARLQVLLHKRYLWLSDEHRTMKAIDAITASYFSGITFNIFYEVGEFDALFGFLRIHPEFKCELTLKLINPEIWGADFVRAGKELIDLVMKELRLKRITIETADKRIAKMAKMAGFVDEGKRKDDLRWDGKFYPKFLLGKYE